MLAAGEPVVEEAPRRDVAGEDALDESGVLASEEVSRPVGGDVCEARICDVHEEKRRKTFLSRRDHHQ